MALTEEQVWVAADQLEENGERPTLMALRKALGGGSFSTISAAMAKRREDKVHAPEPVLPLPQPLEERVAVVGRQLWAAALECAGGRLQADRDQFERSRLLLEAERDEALELASQLTAELEGAYTRLDTLVGANTALKQVADEHQGKLAACNEQLAAAHAAKTEASQHIANLVKELERVNEANLSLIESLAPRQARTSARGTEGRGDATRVPQR